ncbi:MAG TPA: hypothetical protein VGF30_11840 [Bacteroidia bacterium]
MISTSCSDFKQLGKYEKRWAVRHPFASLKIRKIKKQCDPVYAANKNNPDLDTYENGGKLDAYRHLFYTLAFTFSVKPKKVLALGEAHEKDNYLGFLKNKKEETEVADSMSCQMDLLNNAEAANLIIKLHHERNIKLASDVCIKHIKEGKAWFMKRDEQGNYLRCNGSTINLEEYKGKWNIPKCLIQK